MNQNYILITASCLFTLIFYLLFEFIFTGGAMGVPLDDTWIHFQFADNFSKGDFFQYNPGEYTAGTTSPLYVIVLGTIGLLTGNFIIASLILSFVFYFLSCIYVYKLTLLILESEYSPLNELNSEIKPSYISLIVSLLTVFSGRLAWSALSGMETTMFIFFCILGIYIHAMNLQKGKTGFLPALIFGLASVSRPEGYLLASLYFFDLLMCYFFDKRIKIRFYRILFSILLYCLIILPYLIFSYIVSGDFFPNTYRGQGGFFRYIPNFEYLRIVTVYFFRDNFITAILYLFSIVFYLFNLKKFFKEFRFLNLIFLWIILLPVVSSILIPNWRHHVRYMIPLIPFINIVSIYMFLTLINMELLSGFKKIIAGKKNLISLFVVFSLIYYVVFAIALGKNTDNINSQQIKLAHWVRDNVGRNETIALNDIGAITFLNKNKIIDMAGLVTPEVLRYRKYQWDDNLDSLNYLLMKNNVSYIIIYDEWFKEYLDKYGNTLTHITSAVLEENTICGGIEMKVYKTNFLTGK